MIVYILWLASWAISGSLFEVYFYNLGLSFSDIFLAGLFWYAGGVLVTPLFRGFESKRFMLIGIVFGFLAVAVLYFFPDPAAAYPFRFLIGIPHFFFWVPFNVRYYEFRRENNAFLSAVYYSLMPLLSLVLPAAAGWVAGGWGFSSLYTLAMGGYAVTFLVAWKMLDHREYRYYLPDSLRSMNGLRSLVFLEGFAGTIIVSIILETMLLAYIHTPFEYGGFISLVTLFSIVASLATARVSDRYKQRGSFLLAAIVGFALSAILASQAHDVATFFIGFGLINFFRTIFFPLPLALVVDNSRSLVDTMVGREFILGIGRVLGVVVGYIILIYTNIQTVLLFNGFVLLLYIPLFQRKKKKLIRQ